MGASSAISESTVGAHLVRAPYRDDARMRARFSKFIDATPDGCWRWLGAAPRNRPTFSIGYKRHEAVRIAWAWHRGALGAGARLSRTCGEARCVNPQHHRLQVRQERRRREDRRRLTQREVAAILRGYAQREVTVAELARIFGRNPTTVWAIVTGRRQYARLPDIALPPPRTRRRNTCLHEGTA